MAVGRHFENSFIAISQPEKIWHAGADCVYKVGYLTKYQNFANSQWRTAAILKIVFWLYPDERLSD